MEVPENSKMKKKTGKQKGASGENLCTVNRNRSIPPKSKPVNYVNGTFKCHVWRAEVDWKQTNKNNVKKPDKRHQIYRNG